MAEVRLIVTVEEDDAEDARRNIENVFDEIGLSPFRIDEEEE